MQDEQIKFTQHKLSPEDIAVSFPDTNVRLNLSALFCRPGPVEVEIGSGKGTFLLHQARNNSNINYLGIEYANKFYRFSVDRLARWGMTNVRLLRTDARDFIRCSIGDGCVQAYHIYFPDPWPKKRQQKRRFFRPETILHVARTLAVGGELRTATDHAEYYDWICELMLRHERITPLFEPIDFFPTDAADTGEWVGSNFERKYIKEGRPIYTLALRRRNTIIKID